MNDQLLDDPVAMTRRATQAARFERGRILHRQGAVLCVADPADILVRGSAGRAYTVDLSDLSDPWCSCPDDAQWCKHVAAAAHALAVGGRQARPISARQMHEATDRTLATDNDQQVGAMHQLAARVLDVNPRPKAVRCGNPWGTCGRCCSRNLDRIAQAQDDALLLDRGLAAMFWLTAFNRLPADDREPLLATAQRAAVLVRESIGLHDDLE